MEKLNNNRIKELRIKQNKTQKDVADFLGITEQALSWYERAQREPKIKTWQKLADYFGVSIGYLQGVIDDDSEKKIIDKYQKRLIHDLDLIIDNFQDRTTEELGINTDLFFAGIELSKKVTEFTKNFVLLPLKPMTEKEFKELNEYIVSQLDPILDKVKNSLYD